MKSLTILPVIGRADGQFLLITAPVSACLGQAHVPAQPGLNQENHLIQFKHTRR
jgi:hypothetical protein